MFVYIDCLMMLMYVDFGGCSLLAFLKVFLFAVSFHLDRDSMPPTFHIVAVILVCLVYFLSLV